MFGFAALAAVIVNKAMSLVVVIAAIPARLAAVPLDDVVGQWPVVLNLLAGSLVGAWLGVSWATRMATSTLYRILAALLVFIAAVFAAERIGTLPTLDLTEPVQLVVGTVAGFGIGVVAALMGVAGGELLIPTLVLLFAVDVKLAGSLSLVVSLPTMLVAFFRYSRDQAFCGLGFQQAVRRCDGRRVRDRLRGGWAATRSRPRGGARAAAGGASAVLRGQGVAACVVRRSCPGWCQAGDAGPSACGRTDVAASVDLIQAAARPDFRR